MNTIKYIVPISFILGLVAPTMADKQFTKSEQKKIDYLILHEDKLYKLEHLPEWKKQMAYDKYDLTQEEVDAAQKAVDKKK